VLTTVLAAAILGVPAALIGSVLPLTMRSIAPATAALGRAVGGLLTWNTCGAVVGVLLTGFVVMPNFGLRAAFLILAMGLVLTAFLIARRCQATHAMAACGAGAVLIFMSIAFGGA